MFAPLPIVLLIVLFLVLLATRIWYHATKGKFSSVVRMDGKTVIVTGSNTGIGKETARGLAERGARVILACRDLQKANEAKADIIESSGNSNVVVAKLDLSSLKSVQDFVKWFLQNEKRLDVLVNNAAAGSLPNELSADGLQKEMQINQYGPFLLTNMLLDILKKSSPSRVVNVASMNHKIGDIDLENLNCEKYHPGNLKHYSNAKLGNILFSNELARRLDGTEVTSNSLHPGLVDTEIFRNIPSWQLFVVKNLLKYVYKDAKDGAETSLYLAVSEEVEGVTGKYFRDCKEAPLTKKATDKTLARNYWDKCAELVHLKNSLLDIRRAM